MSLGYVGIKRGRGMFSFSCLCVHGVCRLSKMQTLIAVFQFIFSPRSILSSLPVARTFSPHILP